MIVEETGLKPNLFFGIKYKQAQKPSSSERVG